MGGLLIPLLFCAQLTGAAPGGSSSPPPVTASDQITVTATRTEQRLGDTAASLVVLSAEEIAASAAPSLDDVLRQVPGFTLFRRSGSRFANPTTQGVSLRGVGASGASRAIVLADGIPLNDPFGGWIYWGRVPRASLSRVEVMRGGASDLYGSAALSGAVQLLTRGASSPALYLDSSWGDHDTPEASLFGAYRRGAWGASLAGEAFRTDGYVLVDPQERGPVDAPAASRHTTLDLTVERTTAAGARLFARGSHFEESRENGTPLQTNDTGIRQATLGADRSAGDGSLAVRAWASDQDFHQTFSAVAEGRASERLIRSQRVPADAAGLSFQGSRALGSRHALVSGLELRQVRGESDELAFTGTRTSNTVGGGRQRTGALFLEDLVSLSSRVSLTAGGRLDRWENSGERRTAGVTTPFPDRTETALSPRVSLLVRATGQLSWTASAYRAFRAPTLNELYRAFRVGDVVTLANEDLQAERLTGAETGALWTGPAGIIGRLTARGTLFWMEIDDTIANVTLSVAPDLITRQRQNLGRTRSRGLETEFDARAGSRWSLSGGYLFSDARVTDFPGSPANRALEGLRLPQVPRHQATFQVRFDDPALFSAGLQARWTGDQFDDDQNRFRLGSFTTVDVLASRAIGRGRRRVTVFVAAENLFDQEYEIGRTPLRTLGPPRLARIGLRVELP
jgi:outer membrane receptor protein involved in Fe transport